MAMESLLPIPLVAFVFVYWWRSDFAHYSIFTVGTFRRISRRAVRSGESECADGWCEATAKGGERRLYYKEVVVAGAVLYRYDSGERYYCEDHASFEFLEHGAEQTTTERLALSGLKLLVDIIDAKETVRTHTEQSEFQDIQNNVSTVFSLAPVLLMVLSAVAVIGVMKRI